jgi:hypothetical protein
MGGHGLGVFWTYSFVTFYNDVDEDGFILHGLLSFYIHSS